MHEYLQKNKNLICKIKYLKKLYPEHKLISDIGSGLKRIFDGLFEGTIRKVVIASKDRFSRFGFELFEEIFSKFK